MTDKHGDTDNTVRHGYINQHGFTNKYRFINKHKGKDKQENTNNKLLEADLSYKIRGCFYNVFNKYGPGLKEIIYQKALEEEFERQGLKFQSQKRIKIYSLDSRKILGTYIPDFIIEDKIIVEIKAVNYLTPFDMKQQRSYLKSSSYQIAYLVNFGIDKLEIRRSIYTNDRKSFINLLNPYISENPLSISENQSGLTLMELLIVITLLVILAVALLVLLNPSAQIGKGQDSKRKKELTELRKVLEDYYNDKNCYPRPSEICYNAGQGTTCNICGHQSTSPSLSPYLARLPCDPQHPRKQYLYQVDSPNCPRWYRIYTILSNTNDPAIAEVGCQYGCGPSSNISYNYGVSSPNISLEPNINFCSNFSSLYVITNTFCNICGSYQQCQVNFPNQTYYIDPGGGGIQGCTIACVKN